MGSVITMPEGKLLSICVDGIGRPAFCSKATSSSGKLPEADDETSSSVQAAHTVGYRLSTLEWMDAALGMVQAQDPPDEATVTTPQEHLKMV